MYFDIVVVDADGRVVANGHPDQYPLGGLNFADEPWFRSAIGLANGAGFGFQAAHRGRLAAGAPVLVYSCPVFRSGPGNLRPLGVLGVVFRWEGLGATTLRRTAQVAEAEVELALVDPAGTVLASTDDRLVDRGIPWPGSPEILASGEAMYSIVPAGNDQFLLAKGTSPGFETYATGWSCLIRQRL